MSLSFPFRIYAVASQFLANANGEAVSRACWALCGRVGSSDALRAQSGMEASGVSNGEWNPGYWSIVGEIHWKIVKKSLKPTKNGDWMGIWWGYSEIYLSIIGEKKPSGVVQHGELGNHRTKSGGLGGFSSKPWSWLRDDRLRLLDT